MDIFNTTTPGTLEIDALLAVVDEDYVEAWKEGMSILGSKYFEIGDDVSFERITHIEQGKPILEMCFTELKEDKAKNLLLRVMCAFYWPHLAKSLLEDHKIFNFDDVLLRLPFRGRKIAAKLKRNSPMRVNFNNEDWEGI